MRLDRFLAQMAGMSRKEAARSIALGRVKAGGVTVTDPAFPLGETPQVLLDGLPVGGGLGGRRYYMLHKPPGVVCATKDSREAVVLSLLPPGLRKGLFPVGRLDKDTTGLLLVTDDGAFAHRLTAPGKALGKTYRALLDGPVDLAHLAAEFACPLDLGGGDITSPARLSLVEEGPPPLVELTIYEGRYHQVKRMFARYGREVLRLRRVAVGNLWLDDALSPGQYRPLTPEELALAQGN